MPNILSKNFYKVLVSGIAIILMIGGFFAQNASASTNVPADESIATLFAKTQMVLKTVSQQIDKGQILVSNTAVYDEKMASLMRLIAQLTEEYNALKAERKGVSESIYEEHSLESMGFSISENKKVNITGQASDSGEIASVHFPQTEEDVYVNKFVLRFIDNVKNSKRKNPGDIFTKIGYVESDTEDHEGRYDFPLDLSQSSKWRWVGTDSSGRNMYDFIVYEGNFKIASSKSDNGTLLIKALVNQGVKVEKWKIVIPENGIVLWSETYKHQYFGNINIADITVAKKSSNAIKPTMQLSLTPNPAYIDEKVKVTWTSQNAEYCIQNTGMNAGVVLAKSFSGYMDASDIINDMSGLYSMTCFGVSGSVSKSVELEIKETDQEDDSNAEEEEEVTGTYKGYMNGKLFITTKNISRLAAQMNCLLNSTENPRSSMRCTWDGIEIVSYTPESSSVSKVPPKSNRMSCDNPLKIGLSSGALACYGIWDYGNDFGGDKYMCPDGSYSDHSTGCRISTPACLSGYAKATGVYRPARGEDTSAIASNLGVSEAVAIDGLASVWRYDCTY